MPISENIIKQIEDFSSEQLANFICEGEFTLEELQSTGEIERTKIISISILVEEIKKDKVHQANKQREQDKKEFEIITTSDSIESINAWIAENPNNLFIDEAKSRLEYLISIRIGKIRDAERIIQDLRINPNSYSPSELQDFLKNKLINLEDLHRCQIPNVVIEYLQSNSPSKIKLITGETPTHIPNGKTEVYFWGMQGSGKTCALASILSTANQSGILTLQEGTGLNYAQQLSNIFKNNNNNLDLLPSPTNFETTQFLPFTLQRNNEKEKKSIALIELSGEIFKCFHHKVTNQNFPSEVHEKTFQNLQDLLNSKNRKLHFFFIDYERSNSNDTNYLTQQNYLDAARIFFEKNNIFSNYTDGIYIILTKSDLLKNENGDELEYNEKLIEIPKYFNENGYGSFIRTLKNTCIDNSINGGVLKFEPFSLGQVYLKDLCQFNNSSALKIIDIIIQKSQVSKKSTFGFFNK